MPDPDLCGPDLPGPRDLAARPKILVAQLEEALGASAAARLCADLLAGAEPHLYADALPYLGEAGTGLLVRRLDRSRVLAAGVGARGLRYVWVADVATDVISGLASEHWRVAEMCVKVAGQRDLGEAGEGAARLTRHHLPRAEAAVRALGGIGDTEHVAVVREACSDPVPTVRRVAAKALATMVMRLDLT